MTTKLKEDPRVTGIDALSRSGAHEIVERIIRYWEERGHKRPLVWIEPIKGMESTFVVRSNMISGLPQ
jgi:hypothetical protein